MSESQHLVPNLNETMEEQIEMGDGMNLEHQSSVDRQLVTVITEQEQVRELHMEMEAQVLAVIPAETERGTVTESRKRKRRTEGEKENPEVSERERTFITEKAQTVFEKELKERGFVCERGSSQLISPFKEVIEKRGWQELVEHKKPGLSNLVREFYANMDQMREKCVFVRGKWISFDRDTINRILNLQTTKDGHKFKKMKKEPEYKKIVGLLSNGKGKWHSTSKDQHKEIFGCSLTEEAKVWFYFLASTLLPSKNLTTVRRKEAILLYSLLKGYKMNVRKIIEESILDYFNTKYRGYLPHLAIVTKLCSIQELSYYWE